MSYFEYVIKLGFGGFLDITVVITGCQKLLKTSNFLVTQSFVCAKHFSLLILQMLVICLSVLTHGIHNSGSPCHCDQTSV